MATCSVCGGFKVDGYKCPTCTKIEFDRELAQDQNKANQLLAREQIKTQFDIADSLAKNLQVKHNELMEIEERRLKEQKKQTQILLEQSLTEEEVYQIGLNFEEKNTLSQAELFGDIDSWVLLSLDEKGNIVEKNANPYVQEKFRKAYQKGINDRLKRDYSIGPGIQFMIEAAFQNGYLRKEYPTIYFPDQKSKRFALSATNPPYFYEAANEKTGELECLWDCPYESEFLNRAFEEGVDKYLAEQNTLENKESRLAKLTKENTEKQAAAFKSWISNFFATVFALVAFGAYLYFVVF